MSTCNDPCDPCPSPYDNCGCPNPTTFGCVTYQGTALECTEIANGENGDDILAKIDAAVCALQENEGKVLIDGDDTCPEYLFDKLAEGTNISFQITGTGCDRVLTIHAIEGGVPVDVNVSVTSNDTTTGYLYDKIDPGTYMTKSVLLPAGNEKLRLQIVPSTLLSADFGNMLTLGTDGKFMTSFTTPDGTETEIVAGTGITVSGSGAALDPYIISTNPTIQVARSCFDGVWRAVTLVATGNANVVYVSGTPQYRYRYDGTVEFRGSASYTVAFGAYSSGNRKFTITVGGIPTTCLTAGELAGIADLKNVNYIDAPQASSDQITQQYGYIIRRSGPNMILEFQSSFTNATSKSIVVNFEGCVIHPQI